MKIYKVTISKIAGKDFYISTPENNYISNVYQTEELARKGNNVSFGIAMDNGEVIQYGEVIGRITSKELIA